MGRIVYHDLESVRGKVPTNTIPGALFLIIISLQMYIGGVPIFELYLEDY